MQEFTKEQNIKEKNQIYYSSQSEHSLIIHQIPTNSAYQQQKLHRCLDHVSQLTRTRKWKHKEGRDSSHSYWSRTHGPRGTTHGTFGRRPWLWMVSRRGVPPSGRVPEQLLQAAPILKRRRRRYRGEFAEKRSILGVSTPRAKYRRRGHRGTHRAARR